MGTVSVLVSQQCKAVSILGYQKNYVHPTWGGHIIFAFSGVRRHTWFPVISRKIIYPIFTKFGIGFFG